MMQIFLIGIGAGISSALLFASVDSGALISIPLFFLSPLPILLAALGWTHWTGLIAALVASAGLAFAFGDYFFLVSIGLPAWWLGYLAMLARPAPGHDGDIEWYPPDRLVLWCAVLGALVVAAAIPFFGTDRNSFQTALRTTIEQALDPSSNVSAPSQSELPRSDLRRLVDYLVFIIPPAAAMLSTTTFALNLWLAGSIVKISGRLQRSWPNILAMAFPRFAPAAAGAATLCSLLPNLIGTMSALFAASLYMAYALLGFVVLHAITRQMTSRRFVLAGVYATVAVFGWPVLILTLLGFAEAAFRLRARFGLKRDPPQASDSRNPDM
jgi:hypothetical protein